MRILELRTAISDTLKARVPVLRGSYTHGGRFTYDDLKRIAVQTPCTLTACLSIPDIDHEGGINVANAQWGVFVVCQGDKQEKRDAQALALVELIANEIYVNDWDMSEVGTPKEVKATNLYNPVLDSNGLALWVVSWTQSVDLVPRAEGVTPFLRFFASYDTLPADDEHDSADFTQLEGDAS